MVAFEAQICRNLHVLVNAQHPLFHEQQMPSRVSGLSTCLPAAAVGADEGVARGVAG